MKLARYEGEDGAVEAVLSGKRLIPIAELGGPEQSILDVLGSNASLRDELSKLAADLVWKGAGVALEAARLLPPIERPPKYLAMAFNADHDPGDLLAKPDLPEAFRDRLHTVVATNEAYPKLDIPTVFNKQTSCVSGPTDEIWAPPDAHELDYEGELVIVIAKRARRLSVKDAPSIIGGYTVGNDVSIREWQFDTPTHWMGKSLETFGPIGPVIVTPDEIDADNAPIKTWVNDEIRQDGSTAERKFKVAEVVSWISQRCTLEPGDLIATGTGGGLAQFDGRYMKAGDTVAVEIPPIGRLENKIVPEPVPV